MGEIRLYSWADPRRAGKRMAACGRLLHRQQAEQAVSHMLTLYGYDAMLKAEAVWLTRL